MLLRPAAIRLPEGNALNTQEVPDDGDRYVDISLLGRPMPTGIAHQLIWKRGIVSAGHGSPCRLKTFSLRSLR